MDKLAESASKTNIPKGNPSGANPVGAKAENGLRELIALIKKYKKALIIFVFIVIILIIGYYISRDKIVFKNLNNLKKYNTVLDVKSLTDCSNDPKLCYVSQSSEISDLNVRLRLALNDNDPESIKEIQNQRNSFMRNQKNNIELELSKKGIDNIQNLRLADFHIASSFRSCFSNDHTYCSTKILKKILNLGVRFLWFDIFTETLDEDSIPIVGHGIEKGSWINSLNYVTFNDVCETIKDNAFTEGKVPNSEDPLIIALNLNVNNNKYVLEKIQKILTKWLSPKMLDSKYGFQQRNIGEIPISNLMGKVIIFSSGGYYGSTLEEIINYSWDKEKLRVIEHKSIDPTVPERDFVKIEKEELKNFNTSGLSIIVSSLDSKYNVPGVSFSKSVKNYDTQYAFQAGCQFICINYADVSSEIISPYINKFMHSSFVPKSLKTRAKTYGEDSETKKDFFGKLDKKNKPNTYSCPIKPTETTKVEQIIDEPIYMKDDNKPTGVCVLSNKCENDWLELRPNQDIVLSGKNKEFSPFKLENVNYGAGMDLDQNEYYNIKPKICCSKKKENIIDSYYSKSKSYAFAPYCNDPKDLVGRSGFKVKLSDVDRIPFDTGSISNNYKWVHPSICKINNNKEFNNGKYCLLSNTSCPSDWNNNGGKDIELENNWRLCCRNLDL